MHDITSEHKASPLPVAMQLMINSLPGSQAYLAGPHPRNGEFSTAVASSEERSAGAIALLGKPFASVALSDMTRKVPILTGDR